MTKSPPVGGPLVERIAPEPRFWQHYSPHHEASLSSLSSFALHSVLVGFLLVVGYVGWLGFRADAPKVSVDTIASDKSNTSDTKFDPIGNGALKDEAPAVGDPRGEIGPPNSSPRPNLPGVEPPASLVFQIPENRPLRPGDINKTLSDLGELHQSLSPRGQPGSSSDSNPGKGRKGRPDGTGVFHGTPVPRAQRWDLNFNIRDSSDYLRQLEGLGAVLVIPTGNGDADWKVVRELSRRPTRLLDEDVTKIPGICWRDDDARSVAGVIRVLELNLRPDHFNAFLPIELEQKLARLEHEHAGRSENQIGRTFFRVVRSGSRYDVEVINQEPLR